MVGQGAVVLREAFPGVTETGGFPPGVIEAANVVVWNGAVNVERRNLTQCRGVMLLENEIFELNLKETGFGNLD